MDRLVWVGAFPSEDRADVRSIVTAALEAGFDQIVLDRPEDGLQRLGRFSPIFLRGSRFEFDGQEIGRFLLIERPEDESAVRALRGVAKHVVVRATDWKVIPFENLIAAFQGSGTRLLAEVRSADEARLFFETMEVGVDGILLRPSSPRDIAAVRTLVESRGATVPLVPARITALRSVGLGDRVCVDTCFLLRDGEGMLVGNASSGMFLVHAETIESGYVAARPFRVNAGPVHAYILLPDGTTKYLSELRAGDEVLVADAQGRSRSAIVGRLKIERRPLVLVEAEAAGVRHTTLVQNAETIRFVTPAGEAVSVSRLRTGDEVLLRLEEGGRHFGMPIHETITER
jgi:3-dehydroquinate synthase II